MDAVLKAFDREIQWFERHRDYFQTSACADTAISRLRSRREQIEQILLKDREETIDKNEPNSGSGLHPARDFDFETEEALVDQECGHCGLNR